MHLAQAVLARSLSLQPAPFSVPQVPGAALHDPGLTFSSGTQDQGLLGVAVDAPVRVAPVSDTAQLVMHGHALGAPIRTPASRHSSASVRAHSCRLALPMCPLGEMGEVRGQHPLDSCPAICQYAFFGTLSCAVAGLTACIFAFEDQGSGACMSPCSCSSAGACPGTHTPALRLWPTKGLPCMCCCVRGCTRRPRCGPKRNRQLQQGSLCWLKQMWWTAWLLPAGPAWQSIC